MISKDLKIYIAGHQGMVGSVIYRLLKKEGYTSLISKKRSELDLRNQALVYEFFEQEKPDVVINAAARVGGILANERYPYQFLLDNLQIQNNLLSCSHENNVRKFIFLGSSCIYPKFADQPIKEDYLLTGELEPTNQWYAIAKIAGVKLCEALRKQYGRDYISLMPTNLYGPGDNFDLETAHVLPAMIRKFHETKEAGNKPVTLWGSGTPKREFLHVDDAAEAVYFAMQNEMRHTLYNIGAGKDIAIKSLAELIQKIVGHEGEIIWDSSKPDGTPRKLLDTSRLEEAGWTYSIDLEEGIRKTYRWFLDHAGEIKEVKINS